MSNLSKSLALPSARWIGIFPSDIKLFGMKSTPLADEDTHRLEKLLTRPYTSDVVYRELLEMKRINAKAEIEGLADSSCAYLVDVYLRNKIDNKHFVWRAANGNLWKSCYVVWFIGIKHTLKWKSHKLELKQKNIRIFPSIERRWVWKEEQLRSFCYIHFTRYSPLETAVVDRFGLATEWVAW